MQRPEFVSGDELHLSLWNKVELMLSGRSELGKFALNVSWREKLPFYAFKCPVHGIVANYPHGFDGILGCPICLRLPNPDLPISTYE